MGLAALAAPAAQAATYHVQAGESSRKGAPPPAIQNRFMPGTVQVHAGDTVEWMGGVTAPHTVTFLKGRNFAANGFVVPDPTGGVYAEVLDAAGVAFAYSGRPKLIYNVGIAAADRRRGSIGRRRGVQSTGLFGPEFGRATAELHVPEGRRLPLQLPAPPRHAGHGRRQAQGRRRSRRPAAVTAARRADPGQGLEDRGRRLLTAKLPANTVLNGPPRSTRAGTSTCSCCGRRG